MDLLDEWLYEMKAYKWAKAVHDPNFDKNELEKIVNNMRSFFPKEVYTTNGNSYAKDEKNWLRNFLFRKDPLSLGKAIEISNIIDYYKETQKETDFHINITESNMDEVRDRLFELFVGMILSKNGIKVKLDDKYYLPVTNTERLKEKPLDGSFIFKEKKYIIECKKVYSSKTSSLLESMMKLMQDILIDNDSIRTLSLDTMPTGYVLFNETSESISTADAIKRDFIVCYEEYLNGMSLSNNVLVPRVSKTTNQYEICIETALLGNYEKYKEKTSNYGLAILFNSVVKNYKSEIARLSIEGAYKYTESMITSRLRKIIEQKIEQHKEVNFHKIIFLDLEEEVSIFGKMPQHFNIHELNSERIGSVTKEDVSICLLSRRYANSEIEYNIKLFPSKFLNKDLEGKLEKLNLCL